MLSIRDTGSPTTMIKRSALGDNVPIIPYRGRVLHWGASGKIKMLGVARIVVKWNNVDRVAHQAVVVEDNELPKDVDALLGNDMLWQVRCRIENEGGSKPRKLWFQHSTEPIILLDNVDDVIELIRCRNATRCGIGNDAVGQHWIEDVITEVGHGSSGDATVVVRIVRVDSQAAARKSAALHLAMDVTAVGEVMVPPWSTRIIPGSVRIPVGARLDGDVEVTFDPDDKLRHNIGVWASITQIDANNAAPWVPVGLFNSSDEPVYIQAGTRLGVASNQFVTSSLGSGRGGPVTNLNDLDHGDGENTNTATKLLQDLSGRADQDARPPHSRGDYRIDHMRANDGTQFGDDTISDEYEDFEDMAWQGLVRTLAETRSGGPEPRVGGGDADNERLRMYHELNDDEERQLREDYDRMVAEVKGRLSPAQYAKAGPVLERHRAVFTQANMARRDHDGYAYYLRIPTVTPSPVNIPPYRYPADKLVALHDWAKKQLVKGHIEHTSSAWNAPIVLTRKKDGRWRFAIDLRGLNAIASFDPYTLPRIPDLLDMTAGAKWFSALDLTDGYWNCLIHPEDREKTAFTIPNMGRFQWRSMPFGLHASGPHFQKAVESMMAGLSWAEVAVYVDDVLIFNDNFDDHVGTVDNVLSRLGEGGFVVAPKKCNFFVQEIPYLGHTLSQKGLAMTPTYVDKLTQQLVSIKNKDQARMALGMAQFYSRFIWGFAEMTEPITRALKKGIKDDFSNITEGHKRDLERASAELIRAFQSQVVLQAPNYEKEFVLFTDASNIAIGAALCQEDDEGQLRPVNMWSRKLSTTEQKYSATEREALAIMYFTEKFRYYLLGRRFLLVTDHRPLIYIINGASNNSKLARWSLRLQEFCFDVAHLPGKSMVVADALSRLTEHTPIDEWNTNGKGTYIRHRFEGNDEEVIIPPFRVQIREGNISELKPMSVAMTQIREIRAIFDRANPVDARDEGDDKSTNQTDSVDVMVEPRHMVEKSGVINITALNKIDIEFQTIVSLLKGENPDEDALALLGEPWKKAVSRMLEKKRFQLTGGVLWVDTTNDENQQQTWSLFVPQILRRRIMYDKHDAPWSAHMGTSRTRERIKRLYWWPMVNADIENWVSSCEECQKAEKKRGRAWGYLQPLEPVMRPFQRTGMDLIKIAQKGIPVRSGNRHALVVTDYATRYAIIVPIPNKKAETIARALLTSVFKYFGPPEELLSDNGTEFQGIVEAMCRMMGIDRTWSTPYHPKTNGLTERFNRTLTDMLTIATQGGDYIDVWDEKLPMIQLAYNTSVHSSTGFSPHYLMFGRPVQSTLDSMFPSKDSNVEYTKWIESLRAMRLRAAEALASAQSRQKDAYDKRRTAWAPEIGESVWVRAGQVPSGVNAKTFAWLRGPYNVTKVEGNVISVVHHNIPGQPVKINIERLVPAKLRRQEELSVEEERIFDEVIRDERDIATNMKNSTSCADPSDQGKEEAEPHAGNATTKSDTKAKPGTGKGSLQYGQPEVYEIKRIWSHRKFEGNSEYLVEWDTGGVKPLMASWVSETQINAHDLIRIFWDRVASDQLDDISPWGRRCPYNGFDNGCEHLHCRSKSCKIANDIIRDQIILRNRDIKSSHNDISDPKTTTNVPVRRSERKRKNKHLSTGGVM